MIEHIKNIIVVSGAVRLPIFFRFFSSSSSFFLLMLLLLSCFVLFSSSPLFFFFQVFVSTRLLAFTRVCVCVWGGGVGVSIFFCFLRVSPVRTIRVRFANEATKEKRERYFEKKENTFHKMGGGQKKDQKNTNQRKRKTPE